MASGAAYELHSPARCLTAHAADEEHIGFFTATSSLRGSNEVKLLRYTEDTEEIQCAALYHHTGEVISIGACTSDANLISTVYDTVPNKKGTVWKLPPMIEGPDAGRAGANSRTEPAPQELVAVADIPDVPSHSLHSLVWGPSDGSASSSVLAVSNRGLRVWALTAGALQQTGAADFDEPSDAGSFIGGAAWDPHHPGEVAVAIESRLHMWDMRNGECTRTLVGGVPAGGVIRGLSYNPNRPWFMATGGDDYRVKCWDVRKPNAPVKVLEGHSHWVTSLAFNPFHDQLLASGSSDGRVVLWRVSSISSAPLLELDEADALGASLPALPGSDGGGASTGSEGGAGAGASNVPAGKLAADVAVRVHSEHEDTVLGLAWSAPSAWLYASLSYAGRVVMHSVPSGEKYRILL